MKLQLKKIKNEDGTDYLLGHGEDKFYHLPLNNAPVLEGMELLPPLEYVEELAKQNWGNVHRTGVLGFIDGYNKAKETHPNSDDDMARFLDFSKSTNWEKSIYEARCILNGKHIESKEILRIWKEQQPKLPTSFDTETKQYDYTRIP